MSALNVGSVLVKNLSSFNTKEFTLEKGLMNVANVGNSLAEKPTSFDTGQFILELSLISAVNVEDRLARALAYFDIGELICSEYGKLFSCKFDVSLHQRVYTEKRP